MGRSPVFCLKQLQVRVQRYWILLILGIIATIAILGLWQQVLRQERYHLEQLLQHEGTAIELEFQQELTHRVRALERMADRWFSSNGTPQPQWATEVTALRQDFDEFQTIQWVDPSFQVRWVVPLDGNESLQNLDLSQNPVYVSLLNQAQTIREPLLSGTLSLPQGGQGILAVVPLVRGDRFDGFLVGQLGIPELFDHILRVLDGYQVRIHDGHRWIYPDHAQRQSSLRYRSTVTAYESYWQLEVSPTPALLQKQRSPLPNVVLIGGLIGAWTLTLTIYLGHRSERYARRVRSINQQLQAEILQRQEAEANLRISEERWQLALRGNNDGIWDWDVRTNKVFFSSRWKEMLGYADHEVANSLDEWSKRVHPDDLGWVTEIIQDHFAGKTPFYISEHRIQCKDGSYKWILDRGQALWDEAGNVIRMVGSHTDVTQRKLDEVALRESEVRYRRLAEHMNAGLVIHAPDTRILSWNQIACSLLGLSSTQLLGKQATDPTWQFLRQDSTPMPEDEYPVNLVLATGQPLNQYVVGIQQAGKLHSWILVNAFPDLDSQGQISQVVVTFIDITGLKQAEAELRETSLVMENVVAGISKLDLQGRYTYANAVYGLITGYAPQELIGIHWQETVHPDDRATIQLAYQQMTKVGRVDVETRGLRKDGTVFYKQLVMIASYNEQQQLVGHYCFMKDISDRKLLEQERQQTEAALRESEATKQAIIEAIPDLLIRMRTNGSYLDFISNSDFNVVNPDRLRENATVYDVLPSPLAQLRMHYIQQAERSGKMQVYEHEISIQGRQCYEEVRIVPLPDDQVLIMVRDISDRKQAEADLRYQQRMFQAIVDHIPVMIALFNQEGRIDLINPALEQVLGWSIEAWQQRDMLQECYPDPVHRQQVIDHMLAANGSWLDIKTRTASGQIVETSWANVRLSDGRFLGIGQDISDRKHREQILQQAMEAAEAANHAKSLFLANMSHELRTPLNVILGFTQVMSHDPTLTVSHQEDLQTIQRSGDHLLSLINDVLDLSKIEAGHCILEETGFDLFAQLHTIYTMMAERTRAKQLHLELEIAPEVPQFIIADEQKLRQILLNLLSNAIKFTQKGRVVLRVNVNDNRSGNGEKNESICLTPSLHSTPHQATNQLLVFEVSDTGIGIASEDLNSIFDAFVQAEAGKRAINGTGLGLTISRKLLELMGGAISVCSTPNQGSIFTLLVPVQKTSAVYSRLEAGDRPIIGLQPNQPERRILVVDDQADNRSLLRRLLENIGLPVKVAATGKEAIQIWQDWHPHLVWMDIRMPDLDGYETTRQIRALETEPACIIIALTAQASQGDRLLAFAAGCNDYISKPFKEDTLFLKMREYLGLEYCYAQPDSSSIIPEPTTPFPEISEPQNSLADFSPLATLPKPWLEDLETAATCGDDRAIAHLVEQLPAELEPLKEHLTQLAENFQFEQILQLISNTIPS